MEYKRIVCFLACSLFAWSVSVAQTESDYFYRAAKQYVNEDLPGTGQILAEGLQKYPNDPKLNALLEKLKKDQEEQQKKDQQQQNQDQQDQNNQEKQEQESQDKKDGEGEEQTSEDGAEESDEMEEKRGEKSDRQDPAEDPNSLESDLSEREKQLEDLRQRLEQMNLSPEQATQILDAMNSNELQFIQQNRRKPTQRPLRGLPDW